MRWKENKAQAKTLSLSDLQVKGENLSTKVRKITNVNEVTLTSELAEKQQRFLTQPCTSFTIKPRQKALNERDLEAKIMILSKFIKMLMS